MTTTTQLSTSSNQAPRQRDAAPSDPLDDARGVLKRENLGVPTGWLERTNLSIRDRLDGILVRRPDRTHKGLWLAGKDVRNPRRFRTPVAQARLERLSNEYQAEKQKSARTRAFSDIPLLLLYSDLPDAAKLCLATLHRLRARSGTTGKRVNCGEVWMETLMLRVYGQRTGKLKGLLEVLKARGLVEFEDLEMRTGRRGVPLEMLVYRLPENWLDRLNPIAQVAEKFVEWARAQQQRDTSAATTGHGPSNNGTPKVPTGEGKAPSGGKKGSRPGGGAGIKGWTEKASKIQAIALEARDSMIASGARSTPPIGSLVDDLEDILEVSRVPEEHHLELLKKLSLVTTSSDTKCWKRRVHQLLGVAESFMKDKARAAKEAAEVANFWREELERVVAKVTKDGDYSVERLVEPPVPGAMSRIRWLAQTKPVAVLVRDPVFREAARRQGLLDARPSGI